MPGITLAQAETKLSEWITAEEAVQTGQSYRIGDRTLQRADLTMIGDRITFWNKQIIRLTRGGIRITGATPC